MRTEKEYQDLYQSRYRVEQALKSEIITSHEREKRAKKTRWELMNELNRMEHAYDVLQHEVELLLKRPG